MAAMIASAVLFAAPAAVCAAAPEAESPPFEYEEIAPAEQEEMIVFIGGVRAYNPDPQGGRSLLSIAFSVAGAVISAVFLIGVYARGRKVAGLKEQGAYDREQLFRMKYAGIVPRIISIAMGVVTLLFWLYLDRLSIGAVWVNSHTLTIGILFASAAVFCAIALMRERKAYKEMGF
jgi:hypothetical protein